MRSRPAFVPWLLVLLIACAQPTFPASNEQVIGFNPVKLSQMETAIERAIVEHQLPGGVLWLEHKSNQFHRAFGLRAVVPTKEPMTEDTLFDLASMTKVLATVPALMVLQERGQLHLDDPVVRHLPDFKGAGKEDITLRHLLTHTSGFGRTLSRTPNWSNFPRALQSIYAERPAHPPGADFFYSDINFIILGEIVQRIAGMKLENFVAAEIFSPLKMMDTTYLPPAARRPRIAPTERSGRISTRGQVHDPKALAMGGVAGHAGVFATAADVARFARMLLRGGELDGVRLFKPETVRLMTSVQSPLTVNARRGLGWDIDSEFSRPRGRLFPIGSYGHTGFTGVCIWIDPFSETFWIFLSNRVHPNSTGNIYPLQRTLATLAAEAVMDFDFRNVPGALHPRKP